MTPVPASTKSWFPTVTFSSDNGPFSAETNPWHTFWWREEAASALRHAALPIRQTHELEFMKVQAGHTLKSPIHMQQPCKSWTPSQSVWIIYTTWVCVPRWSASAGQRSGSSGACGTTVESDGGSFEESHKGTSWGIHRASQKPTAVSAWWAELCWLQGTQSPLSFPTGPHSCCPAKV